MRRRLVISLCFWALLCPSFGSAETPKDFVEPLPTGSINWTTGVLEATGGCPVFASSGQGEMQQAPALIANRQAAENALRTIRHIRLEATRDVAQVMQDEKVAAKVRQIVQAAAIVREARRPDGALEVTVRVPLRGGFAQLMLPENIKQLEQIRQMDSVTGGGSPDLMRRADLGYSGLIVDARGIGAKPAMVPLLVDESGRQVYGSAFVSREYAVQYGICAYMRSVDLDRIPVRVAPNPLVVKGLRTLSANSCDIVISNTDAARLRGASATLAVLKQCRVIIVLD